MSRYWDPSDTDEYNKRGNPRVSRIIWDIILGFMVFVSITMMVLPRYNVWKQTLEGTAELRRAEQNRQIAVEEAKAKKDAAISLAEAEIERAKGVAESNRIIGEGLKNNEEYLRYLWIMTLERSNGPSVIYIPTEANLPILEAGRRP